MSRTLPTPADLNHRWASFAAMYSAQGLDGAWSSGGLRYLHDFGGSWFAMALLPHGRALCFGWDRGLGSIALDHGVAPEIADRPTWWAPALAHPNLPEWSNTVDVIHAWEDGAWQPDAFDPEPRHWPDLLSHADTVDDLSDWLNEEADDKGHNAPALRDVERIVTAGPQVTEEELRTIAFPDWDVAKGVAAARAFTL